MTKRVETILLLLGAVCAMALAPRQTLAQGCSDDEAMVADYIKDIGSLVSTTRKESLEEFERAYHQRSCLTKLGLSLSLVKEAESCLEKAAQDPAATKQEADDSKAKHEKYAKLEGAITQDQKELKGASDSKGAKAVIAKFDFTQ